MDTMYNIVYNTRIFYDDCEKWDDKERVDKNCANFQVHFQVAQRKYNRKQKVSTRLAVYHSANNLIENGKDTHNVLINLDTVEEPDRDMIMTQSKTISDFTTTIANLTQKIWKATLRINIIKITKVPASPTNRPPVWVDGKHICDAGG